MPVLGRSITLRNRAFTIVGVAGGGFTGVDLNAADAWVPLAFTGGTDNGLPWWKNPNARAAPPPRHPRYVRESPTDENGE